MAKKRNTSRRAEVSLSSSRLEELETKIQNLELINSMYSTSLLSGGLSTNQTLFSTKTRMTTFMQQQEMYSDVTVRGLVSIVINRAIGSTHDSIKPFEIIVSSKSTLNEAQKEMIKSELEYLENIINKNLTDVVMDSQFFGDGYSRKVFERGKGVTKILRNISTHPMNIIPIVTNHGNTIAYSITNSSSMFKSKKITQKNSMNLIAPIHVARLNSVGNGVINITSEQISDIDKHSVFDEKEYAYEDNISGGVMEGVYSKYKKFVWAITSLSNTRIASSVLERFITHNLANISSDEKKLLRSALEEQMKSTLSAITKKVDESDPNVLIANHIIPTTGDGTNNVSIQESSPNFQGLTSIDDIMIHIRNFLGAIGVNIEMTAFGGMTVGGNERDGVMQNSMQGDAQSSLIRSATREYILDIVKTHFLVKYDLEIDLSQIEVNFTSVINENMIKAETQRLESISNTQQVLGIVEQFKSMGFEDNEKNRTVLYGMIKDVISQTATNKEEQIEALVENILKKQNNQDEEMWWD